jgi:putative ABC transport system permease protein
VAAAEEAVAVSRTLDDALDDFGAALRIGWMFALVLAVLLAFNATTINTEERRREHATMFAFGLGSPSVLRTLVLENVLVGLAATVAGVLLGRLILEWVVGSLVRETFPDLGMQVVIGSTTLLVAAAAGLLALATAPLLAARRLRRMDVPSTLRVVE